jgi:hypothetical protein
MRRSTSERTLTPVAISAAVLAAIKAKPFGRRVPRQPWPPLRATPQHSCRPGRKDGSNRTEGSLTRKKKIKEDQRP